MLSIYGRANGMLHFKSKFSKYLGGMAVLKIRYCALVWKILGYRWTVWSLHQKYFCEKIEMVQHSFIHMVGMNNGYIRYGEILIENLSLELGVNLLETRRHAADLMFLCKIINGRINCQGILRQILVRTPD